MRKTSLASHDGTYRVISIVPQEIDRITKTAKWRSEILIQGQFRWSAQGGENGSTKCFVMLDEERNSHVGFVGLTLATEDLESEVNAYVDVEFVYLHTSVRQRRLSRRFIEFITERVNSWLDDEGEALTERKTVLYSTSSAKSDDGANFIRRLDQELAAEAHRRGFEFTTTAETGD